MLEIKVKRHLQIPKCVEKSCIACSHNKHTSWFALTFNVQMMHFIDFWLIRTFVVVAIDAFFPQIFLDWKVESADCFTFRMYGTAITRRGAARLCSSPATAITSCNLSQLHSHIFDAYSTYLIVPIPTFMTSAPEHIAYFYWGCLHFMPPTM